MLGVTLASCTFLLTPGTPAGRVAGPCKELEEHPVPSASKGQIRAGKGS